MTDARIGLHVYDNRYLVGTGKATAPEPVILDVHPLIRANRERRAKNAETMRHAEADAAPILQTMQIDHDTYCRWRWPHLGVCEFKS
jgi:hypothetical protein